MELTLSHATNIRFRPPSIHIVEVDVKVVLAVLDLADNVRREDAALGLGAVHDLPQVAEAEGLDGADELHQLVPTQFLEARVTWPGADGDLCVVVSRAARM